MNKKRRSSHVLLDATEKALVRLIKDTAPVTVGDASVRSTVNIEDQLEVVLAATKFLAVKHKILPDEGDDDDSFITRAQQRLSGAGAGNAADGSKTRRRRDKPRAADGARAADGSSPAPAAANGFAAPIDTYGSTGVAADAKPAETSPVDA